MVKTDVNYPYYKLYIKCSFNMFYRLIFYNSFLLLAL